MKKTYFKSKLSFSKSVFRILYLYIFLPPSFLSHVFRIKTSAFPAVDATLYPCSQAKRYTQVAGWLADDSEPNNMMNSGMLGNFHLFRKSERMENLFIPKTYVIVYHKSYVTFSRSFIILLLNHHHVTVEAGKHPISEKGEEEKV